MTSKKSRSGSTRYDKMVIATQWLDDKYPWGIELREDEDIIYEKPIPAWMETGNYVVCKTVEDLEEWLAICKPEWEECMKERGSIFDNWIR